MTEFQPVKAAPPPPQPLPNDASQPYWDHAAKGEFALPRCEACGAWHETPLEFCRKCGGKQAYQVLSGEGEVYTYLIQHHVVAPGFDQRLPYVIALVSPKEAPELRLVSRLEDIEPNEVRIGQKVKVRFVDLPGGDFKLPVFAPA
jgi:uncharacterized OB-fold protein